MSFKKFLLFILLFQFEDIRTQEINTPAQKMDLKQAIHFAIDNSPSFDSLKRQLNIAMLEEKIADARIYPSLDLTTTHGLNDSSPKVNQSRWGSEFNLGLTQSLYDNGIQQTNIRIARLNKKQAELNFEDQKNKISLDIVTQFLIYSLDVKLLQTQQKQFELINRQYQNISKNYYQGIRTKNDFLRFKTQVNRGEIDLIRAKNNVEKSQFELQRLIGVGVLSKSEIDFTPISLDQVENKIPSWSMNLENHLRFRAAELQKQVNELSSDIVSRKNLPEFFVSTGLSYSSSNYIESGQSFSDKASTSWNALLKIKYNFWDWGIRSREKNIAIERRSVQNNILDTSLLSLNSDLNRTRINMKQIQKNFDLSKELLALEKNNINFIEQEYRNGKVQYLDLINGLNNLSDAEVKYFSAVSDLQTIRYTILYHEGKLYEELTRE